MLHAVSFPTSWNQADAQLESQARDSRTLFLPFHGYLHLGFARSRVVFNPAPSFFSTPILAGRSVDQVSTHQDVTDPEQTEVSKLLADPTRPDLGRCLAALGVSHILLAHQSDWAQLRPLETRGDMRVIRAWPDLTLLALRNPGAPAMTAPADAISPCPAGLRPLASRRTSPVGLKLLAAVPPGRRLVLGLPDAFDWHRLGSTVSFGPWAAYARIYLVAIGGMLLVLVSGLVVLVRSSRTPSPPRRLPKKGPPRPEAERPSELQSLS
jgi:hypothetical protein